MNVDYDELKAKIEELMCQYEQRESSLSQRYRIGNFYQLAGFVTDGLIKWSKWSSNQTVEEEVEPKKTRSVRK